MVASKTPLDDPTLTWEVLPLFPRQGEWTEEFYFFLNRLTNHFVELKNGVIEKPAMPTIEHQEVAMEIATQMRSWARSTGKGRVVIAPYPMRVGQNSFREPDVLVVLHEHNHWIHNTHTESADLVVEILSIDRDKDLVTKRAEYAAREIPEYWVVDLEQRSVTVLTLRNGEYEDAILNRLGGVAVSRVLEGFQLAIDSLPFAR